MKAHEMHIYYQVAVAWMTVLTSFHWRILSTCMDNAMSSTILKLPVFDTGRYWYTNIHKLLLNY